LRTASHDGDVYMQLNGCSKKNVYHWATMEDIGLKFTFYTTRFHLLRGYEILHPNARVISSSSSIIIYRRGDRGREIMLP